MLGFESFLYNIFPPLNSAWDSISGAPSGSVNTAIETLKEIWDTLPESNAIGTISLASGGPRTGCVYFKLNINYGAAILFSYHTLRPVYITKNVDTWSAPIQI